MRACRDASFAQGRTQGRKGGRAGDKEPSKKMHALTQGKRHLDRHTLHNALQQEAQCPTHKGWRMVVVGGWTTQRGHEAKIPKSLRCPQRGKWGQRQKDTHKQTNRQAKKQTEDEGRRTGSTRFYFIFLLFCGCVIWLVVCAK